MSIKEDTKVVQSFLKELPQNTVIQHIKTQTAKTGQDSVKVQRVFRATKPLSVSYAQLHSQLKEKLKSLGEDVIQDVKDEIQTLLQTLTPKYQKGDQLQKVQGIEKIIFADDDSFTQEESQFEVEQGIAYLVDIWATWCGPCQGPMDHNQKMLDKNAQWEGKVKIVGISVDDETEAVTERVKSKKWKSIQHYRFLKGWDDENPLIQYLQLRGIPFVMLINKQGQIDYLGHPSKTNLEARINELIATEEGGAQQADPQQADAPKPQELLTKEEFKELKQQLNNIQTTLKEAEFEGIVEVVLEKVNYWNQDGSKEVHKRTKLVLSYDIDVKEEGKINSFLENHWNKIPENLKTVKESKIRDPARQIKEIQTKFQETYAALGVNISYNSIQNTQLSYNPQNNSSAVTKSQKFSLAVNNITTDQYKAGQENLKEFLGKFDDEESQEINSALETITEGLRSCVILGVGKQFQTISNYKKWGSEEYTTIEHQPGQVLFLDYWAKWCGPCVREIKKNTTLLQQNAEKWGQAVRFVSLSLVSAEDATEFMENNQESLKYIDFYFPKEQRQSDTTLYGVQYIPHYVVVDKFGTIRKLANIANVEQLVEELINEQAPSEKSYNKEVNISQDYVDKVIEILQSENTNEKLKKVDQEQIIQLDAQFEQFQVEGQVKYKVPSLNLFCRDSQLEAIDQVLNKIYQLIPENDWTISKTVSKTFSVPYPGSNCFICYKNITYLPQQYYSPFKKEFLCVECAEFDDKTKIGAERYKCTDNLVFINGPLSDLSVLENIDDHKIGKNLQLKEGEKGSQRHPMMCNGCGQGTEGPRYIAVSARPGKYRGGGYVDYCQNCFVELKYKESEKAQAIIQKDSGDGMVKDSLLVRILFSHGDYRDF